MNSIHLENMTLYDDSDESSCDVDDHEKGWCDHSDDGNMGDVRETDLSQWNDVVDSHTVATFDQATHDAWEIARNEISIVRQNITRKLRLDIGASFSIELLLDAFIGANSALWHIINDHLNDGKAYLNSSPLRHEVFKKIMGTFFVASSLRISAKTLYDDALIDKSKLCSYEEYLAFWKAITMRDSQRYDSSKIYLWQLVVDVVNSLCRDFFLSNWESQEEKHVTADDDKYHFNGRMGFYDTCGLKPSQFTRENRRGFVFHTLVFTASGIPLGLEAEHISDSGSFDTVSRLLTQQLAPGHRSSTRIPNLTRHVIYADRLYWEKKFLYNYVLPSGADVGPSTHKRVHDFPFTYEQKLTRNDTRELIEKKGAKCIKLKKRQAGPHFLAAIAYRDGYGKVALGISSGASRVLSKHWDFHLMDPKDRYRVLDDSGDWSTKPETWIRCLTRDAGLSEIFLSLLRDTAHVQPMTTSGSEDQAWFVARAFSFTSSTTDKVIHAAADYAYSCQDDVFIEYLNKILMYLHKPLIPLFTGR
jgi:hypothetical protein